MKVDRSKQDIDQQQQTFSCQIGPSPIHSMNNSNTTGELCKQTESGSVSAPTDEASNKKMDEETTTGGTSVDPDPNSNKKNSNKNTSLDGHDNK